MNVSFTGKRALVTGVGKGVGYDLAKALAAAGADVFALSRTQADLDKLKEEDDRIHIFCVNLCDWERTRETIEDIIGNHGIMHLLVNNAAVAIIKTFLENDKIDIDEMLDTNLKAVYNVSQVISKGLILAKSPGSIVNVSSIAGLVAHQSTSGYSATKGGLDSLTRVMALELGPHKIRVNSVNPGIIATRMSAEYRSDPIRIKPIIAKIPLGRIAEVEEVVNPIMFLLSDKASMIHGVTLPIDGGYVAC